MKKYVIAFLVLLSAMPQLCLAMDWKAEERKSLLELKKTQKELKSTLNYSNIDLAIKQVNELKTVASGETRKQLDQPLELFKRIQILQNIDQRLELFKRIQTLQNTEKKLIEKLKEIRKNESLEDLEEDGLIPTHSVERTEWDIKNEPQQPPVPTQEPEKKPVQLKAQNYVGMEEGIYKEISKKERPLTIGEAHQLPGGEVRVVIGRNGTKKPHDEEPFKPKDNVMGASGQQQNGFTGARGKEEVVDEEVEKVKVNKIGIGAAVAATLIVVWALWDKILSPWQKHWIENKLKAEGLGSKDLSDAELNLLGGAFFSRKIGPLGLWYFPYAVKELDLEQSLPAEKPKLWKVVTDLYYMGSPTSARQKKLKQIFIDALKRKQIHIEKTLEAKN